ncbi:hypothetical protein PENANT_c128G04669 [Penicillium antarcticum]|uniref:Uncharacterized protein n=1 Tax=Penicillium antarcticum TaxID=416450 RepID=A0A1V6PH22_9EURO|nr:hypothetical protein PENANT_c128G04669 [Penicillium antarcticum]
MSSSICVCEAFQRLKLTLVRESKVLGSLEVPPGSGDGATLDSGIAGAVLPVEIADPVLYELWGPSTEEKLDQQEQALSPD